MRTLFAVASLSLTLPLAGCEEDEPTPEPAPDYGDAASPATGSDGGAPPIIATPNSRDGAVARPSDGAVSNPGDGAVSNPTDGGVPGDAPAPSGAKFFLPTIEPNNTAAPSLEIDTQNNVHMVYPAYVQGGAYYATCGRGACAERDDVQAVKFETDGTVGNAMIALTADGRPRILLSTFAYVYYGECESGCNQRANWQYGRILKHDGDKSVTGEALTIGPDGQPRFVIHAYRALFGIGQKPAATELASCAGNCTDPAAWSYSKIADQIWEGSTLLYDAAGQAHLATNVFDLSDNSKPPFGAYLTCASACESPDSWNGVSFFEPYESRTEAVTMYPEVALALTHDARPRFAQVHKNQEGVKTVSYFSCEQDCTNGNNWVYAWSFSGDNVHSGLDLALDAQGHPRLVHTVNYNIAISHCESANCSSADAKWTSELVESGGEIPADTIFLEWNCSIGAWFLHSPSVAIARDGKPVVGYQSRDISGGFSQSDPTKPRCVAGTDMTWSRLAVLDQTF